jgi:hypothetical protein
MMFSSTSKRSEHFRKLENLFQSEANMFILKNLIIEAKRSNLILNCECSIVKQLISNLSECSDLNNTSKSELNHLLGLYRRRALTILAHISFEDFLLYTQFPDFLT